MAGSVRHRMERCMFFLCDVVVGVSRNSVTPAKEPVSYEGLA